MIGLSDSQSHQASPEPDTDEVMFDNEDDEEVLATGRLPMCTSPTQFASYMPPAQELPTTHIRREQEESEGHSSRHRVSTEVYLDIIPAEHWHGPNWRRSHFPQYMPDGTSSSSLDGIYSVGSSSEMLEHQPQLKRKRLQKRSNRLVNPGREVSEMQQPLPPLAQLELSTQSPPTIQSPQSPPIIQSPQSPPAIQSYQSEESSQPSQESPQQPHAQLPLQHPHTQLSAQVPDYAGLRELDRNYTGDRYAYVELLVQAWAQGHCQTGSMFAGDEITLMSQIARLTSSDLGRSLRDSHSICLQRCPDVATADSRSTRWHMVADNESTSENAGRLATALNFGMLSRMVATMTQYAAMLPTVSAQGNVAEPEEYRPPKRAAARRVTGYSGMLRPDPHEFAIAAPRSANSARRRSGVAPGAKAPRGRIGRLPARIERPSASLEPQASSQAPADVQHDTNMDVDHEEELAAGIVSSSARRVKRTTAEEKLSLKERRAAATELFTRSLAAGLSIQDTLANEGVVVQAESLDSWPSMAELAATPFLPIMVRASNDEPAHYIVNSRAASGAAMANQAQGFPEYGVDGFPVPVVPERWLGRLGAKFTRWREGVSDCEEVRVSNSAEASTCQSSSVQGPAMCRGCVTRQTDCPCRFRSIRVNTRLDVTMRDSSKFTRYIAAPMFASQVDSASMALVVKPAPVSLVMGELSGEDGSATTPAGWSELYSLFTTAPTLLKALGVIASVIVEDSSTTPLTSLEYGVLPGYGCSAAPCIYRTISPGFRQVCDMCATSIMSVCFTCCMCATEMCVDCFSEWGDKRVKQRVSLTKTMGKADDGSSWARRFSYCKSFNGTGELSVRLHSQHKKCQFMRVSQFSAADINQVMEKVKSVVSLDDIYPAFSRISSAGVISDTMAQAFAAKIELIEKRTREMYPHEPWELPVMYVQPDELTTAEFSCLWRRGVVVVVRGLLSVLNSEIWQPEWWIKNFGSEIVGILDCADGAKPVGGAWPLRNFYRLFDGLDKYSALFGEAEKSQSGDEPKAADRVWERHKACVERGILKLKDWPPTEDFEARLPDHFRHFMRALPFPEYTQRQGQFNLVNRLPTEFVPPDLGPKMYCAYGSSDGEGGVGTTNLHCDMADAVNIMAYAPPEFLRERGIEVPGIWTRSDDSLSSSTTTVATAAANTDAPAAAAVWDIYPPEAMSDLRKFIGESVGKPYSAECSGLAAAKLGDPIHNQETFLTLPMRRQFFETYRHSCYRIYQIPGDAVFVPAGCAHQVCNYSSAVKVAMDFVSPERVEHCRRLTGEFRQLDSRHPRSRDLLQLGNILWWTFAGQQPTPKQPALSDSDSEDEPWQRQRKQKAKSGSRPKKQPKKSATGSGSVSKANNVSSKDSKTRSPSLLSSLSSSFSIEEQDDDDDDDVSGGGGSSDDFLLKTVSNDQ
ncbi:hypothetical protein GGI08_001278 [Coemansia sp. S2]|nr:hypothetical protein GGI08_001278 [Coemansia sp. S2]